MGTTQSSTSGSTDQDHDEDKAVARRLVQSDVPAKEIADCCAENAVMDGWTNQLLQLVAVERPSKDVETVSRRLRRLEDGPGLEADLSGGPIQDVHEVLNRYLHNFSVEYATGVLATYLANEVDTDSNPVWLLVVAPPSSAKTTILDPLSEVDDVEALSSVTANTFISGMQGDQDQSLLNRLGRQPKLVIKEFGTLTGKDPRQQAEIMGQLREIYDGSIVQHYGTGDTVSWQGKTRIVAGVTGNIDSKRIFRAELGDRFLRLRFGDHTDLVEGAQEAMDGTGEEAECRAKLAEAYQNVLDEARGYLGDVSLGEDTRRVLSNLTALLVRLRTPVERDRYRNDRVKTLPQVEGPYRVSKQFKLVAHALAALRGKTDLENYRLFYRFVYDCMREPRRTLFRHAVRKINENGRVESQDTAEILSRKRGTEKLRDLKLLGILNEHSDSDGTRGRPAFRWTLASDARRQMVESGFYSWLLEDDQDD